jgi:hypothetical protein
MEKFIWRFQCDPDGQDDPVVTIFLGVKVEGQIVPTDQITMTYSELGMDKAALTAAAMAKFNAPPAE